MFNFFSIKDIYDDNVSTYLMIISLCKWIGIFFIICGLFLTTYFSSSWLAIIGGIIIIFIGFFVAIICHYLRKKLEALAVKGGYIVSNIESSVKEKAKAHLNKIIEQNNKTD